MSRHKSLVVVAVWSLLPGSLLSGLTARAAETGIQVGDKVVTINKAPLQVLRQILLKVDEGTEVTVTTIQQPWFATTVRQGDKEATGWIHARHLHKPAMVESYLLEGRLADAEAALEKQLQQQPTDDDARFQLGTVQFLQAIERLMQSLYAHGVHSRRLALSFVRLPVPPNPKPEVLTYTKARQIMQQWIDDLARAEATLAEVSDREVNFPVRFGKIRLDYNGDGRAEPHETLWHVAERIIPTARLSQARASRLVVCFDRGDVEWLRGYCHLLSAVTEMMLAYDQSELFQRTGHLFFHRVDSPYDFLTNGRRVLSTSGADKFFNMRIDMIDLFAFVHLVRFPVKEPHRMKAALEHFETAIQISRKSWKFILAETDDRYEWIPNPKQEGAIGGLRISGDMVTLWHEFLDELEALLAGERLIPFWRGDGKRGINLRRVFTEPEPFDLVLWVQGSAAASYLEEGTLTRREFWRKLEKTFRKQFVKFAVWIN